MMTSALHLVTRGLLQIFIVTMHFIYLITMYAPLHRSALILLLPALSAATFAATHPSGKPQVYKRCPGTI